LVVRGDAGAALRLRYDPRAVKKSPFAIAYVTILAALLGASADAASVRVADGDSIEFGGQRIRLRGIDAPELHQECRDLSGRNWPCGRRARDELRKIIGNDPVQCERRAKDRFGRWVAVCRAGGRDLGEAMVRSGFALAYRDGASPYGAAQSDARSRKAGLWAGSFENPRAWRDEHPETIVCRLAAMPEKSCRRRAIGCASARRLRGSPSSGGSGRFGPEPPTLATRPSTI